MAAQTPQSSKAKRIIIELHWLRKKGMMEGNCLGSLAKKSKNLRFSPAVHLKKAVGVLLSRYPMCWLVSCLKSWQR